MPNECFGGSITYVNSGRQKRVTSINIGTLMVNKAFAYTLICCLILVGCASSGSSPNKIEYATAGSGGTLNICRVSSIMRAAEAPDIKVNDRIVSEIARASMISIPLNLNDKYQVSTDRSLILMREGEVIIRGTAKAQRDRYLMLRGKSDSPAGALGGLSVGTAFIAGALLGGTQTVIEQEILADYEQSEKWAFMEVDKERFVKMCSL